MHDPVPGSPRHAHGQRHSVHSGKPLVSYEGYTFTKVPAEHAGQKETWAIVKRVKMPVSQGDLKDQIGKRRKRGSTALKEYNDPQMKGFKKQQIDELIQERTKQDHDQRFEYVLGSITLDRRRLRGGNIETVSMQVILMRKSRLGIPYDPSMALGGPPAANVDIVDLSGQDDFEKSSQNSLKSLPKIHQHGAFPLDHHHGEPWGHTEHHGVQFVEVANPEHAGAQYQEHAHVQAEAQAHGLEQPVQPHSHPLFHEQAYNTSHGPGEMVEKPDETKHTAPKVEIHSPTPKTCPDVLDSFSESDSDTSSRDTDRTPPTIISSEGHDYHHKERKYRKEAHHCKSGSRDQGRSPVQTLYREHKRKEPLRRRFSPPPSRGSGRTHYHFGEVEIEPEFSSYHGGEPRQRQISYSRERPTYNHRATSYDDEHFIDHDLRGLDRRSPVYHKKLTSSAYPVDLFDDEGAELARERRDRIRALEREDERIAITRERERMYDPYASYVHDVPRPPRRLGSLRNYHDDHHYYN